MKANLALFFLSIMSLAATKNTPDFITNFRRDYGNKDIELWFDFSNRKNIIYVAPISPPSYYLSTDSGKTFKKVNHRTGNPILENGIEVGCDIPYLGLRNGGFFPCKLENDKNYASNKYDAKGILMNRPLISDSNNFLLYISVKGAYYLSTDKGVTFKKVDSNGNPIKDKNGIEVGCDIPYFGLKGGGFLDSSFIYKSDKKNHEGLDIFMKSKTLDNIKCSMNLDKVYWCPEGGAIKMSKPALSNFNYCMYWNGAYWFSVDGVIFNSVNKKQEIGSDVCFVLAGNVFYSGWPSLKYKNYMDNKDESSSTKYLSINRSFSQKGFQYYIIFRSDFYTRFYNLVLDNGQLSSQKYVLGEGWGYVDLTATNLNQNEMNR